MRRLCPLIRGERRWLRHRKKNQKLRHQVKRRNSTKSPVALTRRSSRMLAMVVSSLALTVIGAVAIYALPEANVALPNFSSFAELFPRHTASVPIPDPAVIATLKDIQSAQQRNAAALQENGAAL